MTDRDASPCRPRKCDVCRFNLCSRVKSKKIPATGANDYEIDDEACKRMLCCRCVQVFDYLIYGEGSSRIQCSSCKTSTRKCCVCESDKCLDVAAFDVGYEGFADESGFYCCNHREWSRTWNEDRFEVISCEHCTQYVACDEIEDCDLQYNFKKTNECPSCHSKCFKLSACACCSGKCCTLCHSHKDEEIVCSLCKKDCYHEGGKFQHKESVK